MLERTEYLKRLLIPLWLRPESALWYAHEAYLAHDYLGNSFEQPSLEIGCMDGTATFVMLGGEFGPTFDVYNDEMDIRSHPSRSFSVGLDWQKTRMERSRRLRIHDKFVEHDPNQPLKMFADGQFATIWGSNIYWIDELDVLLQEVRRVLKRAGRMVTVVPDSLALRYSLYEFKDKADPDWIETLDRGRYANISRQARTLPEWGTKFQNAGLRVTRHDRFIPSVLFRTYDVGFRPMFPVLMDIYETLSRKAPDDLRRIKEHWIDTVFPLLAPLCKTEWMDAMKMEYVWHIFELEKSA